MRPITTQTEEEFSHDVKLHRWWREISSSEEFKKILDAVNRRMLSSGQILAAYGINGAYAFRESSEKFQELLESIGDRPKKEDVKEEEYTHGEEEDFVEGN